VNLACAPQRVHIIERDLIRERTRAGLAAAKARGRRGGRRRTMTPAQLDAARALLATTNYNLEVIAKSVGTSRRTLSRELEPETQQRRTTIPSSPTERSNQT
jgi:DNA invertase Pin-like site-specific DNA recombinase